jgi:hypothetical protein
VAMHDDATADTRALRPQVLKEADHSAA